MHDGDGLDALERGQAGLDGVGVHGGAHRVLHRHDLGAAAPPDLRQPLTEVAVRADHERVARLEHVDERGFHAGRPGAGNGERRRVLGLEDLAQHLADVVHNAQEVGV